MYHLKGNYRKTLFWGSKVFAICSAGLELLPSKYKTFEVQYVAFGSSGLSLTTKSIQEVLSQKDFEENRGWKKSAINTLSRLFWFSFIGLRCFYTGSDNYQLGFLIAWSVVMMSDFLTAATYFTRLDPDRRVFGGGKTYNSEQIHSGLSSNRPVKRQNSFGIWVDDYPETKYQLGEGRWRQFLFLFSKLISTGATALAVMPDTYQSNLLKLVAFACSGASLASKGTQELISQLDPNDARGWKKSCINLIARSLAFTYFGMTLFDPESKIFDFSSHILVLTTWMMATTLDISTAASYLVSKDPLGRFFSAGRTWKGGNGFEMNAAKHDMELTTW